ncbi:MAG: hypothetical protein QM426_03420 [Euryarchaeota archaeon]|nr:hypothetical protein [Euryarchaeota archaeon]
MIVYSHTPSLNFSIPISSSTSPTGYNLFAIPLAAGVLYGYGNLLCSPVGAVLMGLSTIIVAINASTLKMR